MTKLSDHFSLEELIHSDTADRRGISNMPTDLHLHHMKEYLVPGLEKVRTILGNRPMTITNAYRNPIVNKAVGGTATSAHPLGYAGDFWIEAFDCFTVFRQLRAAVKAGELHIDQLILESSRKINHVSFDPRYRGMCGHQPGAAGTSIDWNFK